MTTANRILADIAREHLSITTLETRHSDSLDFHNLAVWSIEFALNAAFAAGAESIQRCRSAIDVNELLEERRQIAIIWGTEDIKDVRPDLNEDQSWQVLQLCNKRHDCNDGFTWDLIEYVANHLFPITEKGDRQ